MRAARIARAPSGGLRHCHRWANSAIVAAVLVGLVRLGTPLCVAHQRSGDKLEMRWHLIALALALPIALTSATPVSAQEAIPNDRFSANRFTPAPGPGNYLMVDGAGVGGHLAPSAGLFIDYAHRPFVLFTATCE